MPTLVINNEKNPSSFAHIPGKNATKLLIQIDGVHEKPPLLHRTEKGFIDTKKRRIKKIVTLAHSPNENGEMMDLVLAQCEHHKVDRVLDTLLASELGEDPKKAFPIDEWIGMIMC